MAFCPICKRNHDPDLNCTDGTSQILRDMGIKKSNEASKEKLKELDKRARKYLIIFVIVIILLVLYFIIKNFNF